MRVSAALVIGLLAMTAACCHPSAPEPHASSETAAATKMTAAPVPPHPKVGAVFLGGGDLHTCTAAVLDSPGGDLILTAAHCVAEGIDTTFVAGFKDTADPADVWKVDAIYLDPRWMKNQDPLADFAILRVVRDGGGSVEAEAGGGLALGTAPRPGTVVTVTGYGLGVGGGPIGCQAATELAPGGFPSTAPAAHRGPPDRPSPGWWAASTAADVTKTSRTHHHSTTESSSCSREPRPAVRLTRRLRCSTMTADPMSGTG